MTKDKETDQCNKSHTEGHSCYDEMHDIEGSHVRDAGPAEQAEKTGERHYAETDDNQRMHTGVYLFAHEMASFLAAVWVFPLEGGSRQRESPHRAYCGVDLQASPIPTLALFFVRLLREGLAARDGGRRLTRRDRP